MGQLVPSYTAYTGISGGSLKSLGSLCLSGVGSISANYIPFQEKTSKIIRCEYCRSNNNFDYTKFDCEKCGAPLRINEWK